MGPSHPIKACRICFDTETRLFDIFKYKLVDAYEIVSILSAKKSDGLPQGLCSYCSAMAMKCAKFHELCNHSDQLLHAVLKGKSILKLEDVKKLNRKLMNSKLKANLSITTMDVLNTNNDESILSDIKLEIDTDEPIDTKMLDIKVDAAKNTETNNKTKQPKDSQMLEIKNDASKNREDDINYLDESLDTEILEMREDASKDVKNDIIYLLDSTIFCNESESGVGESKVTKEIGISPVKKTVVKTPKPVEPVKTKRKPKTKIKNRVKKPHGGHNKLDLDLTEVEIVNLTEEQQMEEIEERKKSDNYLNSLYQCDQCFKGFMTEATYSNHMVRHDPRTGAYACPVCRTRCPTKSALRGHRQALHDQKYLCKICPKVSRSRWLAREHNLWHKGAMHSCKICGSTFSQKTSYLTHLRIQHPSDVRCEICGESFISQYGLHIHKKKMHSDIKSLPKEQLGTLCPRCEVRFSNVQALRAHTCDINLSQCVKCGQGFESRVELEAHSGACRGDESAPDTYQCEQCSKTFPAERKLAFHRLQSHGSGGRDDRKLYVCETCGWSCRWKTYFNDHQRKHTGEKPFKCPECPKTFRQKLVMQIHLRSHTGESPYDCKLCPKAFKDPSALTRHMRVHTGVKPYACPHCGRTFSQSNSMKLHVNTVHLKLPQPYPGRKRARAPQPQALGASPT